ncbi:hypothetical protein EDI_325160 [Entamoeba dispar SAW760]|uniref:RING-type domain-containing protein n=1 Tax=Entamoeba dispar (strain ATCC PRA-260 / SAW760) TaxID=370354 RepID=B0EBM7_ENTDS|nr:uncharacterized protein EDI_325160 [Entamoeba dispar SAW760]EDR28039.1 hypothetical protein EDI_325160 [Entamoeba dispar SAW760]|eukprot:EDR28039.1 hypothetical protein EDI_325160 [Entamoeba dispar SAW760]
MSQRNRTTLRDNPSGSKKLMSKIEEKEDIGFFVGSDYTNFIKSRFKTEESICCVFALKEKVIVGSTVGRVYFFNKGEEDIGGEGIFNSTPVLGFALDSRGHVLVIQENNIHGIDPNDGRIEMNLVSFTDEQVTNTTFDQQNPLQYCCVIKHLKTKQITLKITLIRSPGERPTILTDSLQRSYINQMKWIGNTVVIVMSNRSGDGMNRDIIVYFYDINARQHSIIPFNNIEVKSSTSCCVSPLNKEVMVLTWGNLKGEFRAVPGYDVSTPKTFNAPTAFFVPRGVNEIYSLGLLNDKMVGFVNCKDQGAKYGLKVLVSNDERDKKATFSLMPKEDISEYFELYSDRTEEEEYLWLLTERKFMKVKMLQDRDIIDIWKEQKRYDLILERVIKKDMDIDKEELIEYWQDLILSVMDGAVTEVEEPYTLMEEYLESDSMELEDFLEITQNFHIEPKEFREKDSKEAREYEKLKVQMKDGLNKTLLFFTNYTIFSLKKNEQRYYELVSTYNTFYNNRDRNYAYEDAYNTLVTYSKLKETIQRVKSVDKYDKIPQDELLGLMRKELNKYKTLLLYPNLPTNFQEIISNNTIGSKFDGRNEDRIRFQKFNMHYKIENCMFEEAQNLIFKLKDPNLFKMFLEKLQSIYDLHMQNIIEKEKQEMEIKKVFEKEGYNLKNLSDVYVNEVGEVMKKAESNPLLQFRLYQLLFKLLSEKKYPIDNYESRVGGGIPKLLFEATKGSKNTHEMQQIVIAFIYSTISDYNNLFDFRKNEKAVELITSVMEIVNSLEVSISREVLKAQNYGNKKWIITLLYELSVYKDQLLNVLDEDETMETFAQPVCDGLRNASLRYEALLSAQHIAHQQQFDYVNSIIDNSKKGIIIEDIEGKCCSCNRSVVKRTLFKCGHCMCDQCLEKLTAKGANIECSVCKNQRLTEQKQKSLSSIQTPHHKKK